MSRFVSSGAIDPASEAHVEDTGAQPRAAAPPAGKAGSEDAGKNKEAWEAVQREVEEERKRRAAEKGSGEAGKSLFDILQENKGIFPLTRSPLKPSLKPVSFSIDAMLRPKKADPGLT